MVADHSHRFHAHTVSAGCDTNAGRARGVTRPAGIARGRRGVGRLGGMELKRYADVPPFAFADIQLRELTPEAFMEKRKPIYGR